MKVEEATTSIKEVGREALGGRGDGGKFTLGKIQMDKSDGS